MKRILLASVVIAAAVAIIVVWQFVRFLDAPIAVAADGLTYEIAPGTAFAAVSNDLGARGVISHPRIFRWYARLTGDASKVHAGEYRIESGITPPELLQKFVRGDVRLHSFTIVEGWTYRDLLGGLRRHEAILQSIVHDWETLRETLGSEAEHPEGLFLPETYRFPKGTRDTEILRQAYEMMAKTLGEEWSKRADDFPLSDRYEVLILASIVERETARADERAKIAGVFVRRLEKGMRLQTDPTVIYGIGPDFDGNLTRRHLQTDTPYNTYTRAGLPPTPIALPGRAAIHAALNPAPGAELYFVATGLGDGSHKFSATKAEHDAAVAELLARQRDARRKSAKSNGSR
ncbi:MAG TPA: endolytic transglycosylase MltG [Woeseiaceae bacterium]|nr:endolytic transglycosylase MltG [Woeseiaceae bacterium]